MDLQLGSESLGICPTTGSIYTEHSAQDSPEAVDEYDSSGKFIGTSPLPLGVFSASCRYVLPFIALARHGPRGVYDANARVELVEFPWKEDGKTDQHWFRSWNPRNDDLLLMSSVPAGSNLGTTDIYDVALRKVIKSWPSSEDSPPVVWSSDGKATVTVKEHRSGFDPIVPKNPKK